MKTPLRLAITAAFTMTALAFVASAQGDALKTHVAAMKESLEQSRQNLKQYQWTETAVVLLKGEEKSRKVYLAHYGPDGTVQKTEVQATAEQQKPGLRGRIMEKKKEELTDDMKRAVALVKEYVPPDPAKIEASLNSGSASLKILEPGKRVRLDFRDYKMPGDSLGVDFDPAAKRILGANVNTFMDAPNSPVNLAIQFGALPDGTNHPAETTLEIPSKNITVKVTNSNYTRRPTE